MSERLRDPARVRRLARVLFSDIAAYAGEEIRLGLEKDDLFERLAGEIERVRVFYHQQVDPDCPEAETIFNHALVDVLVAGHAHVQTHIW